MNESPQNSHPGDAAANRTAQTAPVSGTREDSLRKITLFDYALHIASPVISVMSLTLVVDLAGSGHHRHADLVHLYVAGLYDDHPGALVSVPHDQRLAARHGRTTHQLNAVKPQASLRAGPP